MATESDEGLWALVMTSCGRFLGKVVSEKNTGADLKEQTMGNFDRDLTLNPAYELTIQTIPIQVAPGKMGMQREISSGPVGLTLEEGAPLHLVACGIMFFDDMKPQDQARYKGLVDQARDLCVKARAQSAGLSVADKGA